MEKSYKMQQSIWAYGGQFLSIPVGNKVKGAYASFFVLLLFLLNISPMKQL